MDLTGIIILALLVAPIALIVILKNQKKRSTLKTIQLFAQQFGGNVMQTALLGDGILGIDTKARLFFYVNPKEQTNQYVELVKVKRCYVNTVSRTVRFQGSTTIIDRVSLCFTLKDASTLPIEIELYNSKSGSHLAGELQLAQEWERNLKPLIE
jgi:hypothetical protein